MSQVSLKAFTACVKKPESLMSRRPDGIKDLLRLVAECQVGKTDVCTIDLDHREAIQNLIWQVGVKEDDWSKAKRVYAEALGYLVEQIFQHDGSAGPTLTAPDALLLGEFKKNWSPFILAQDTWFVHKSSVTVKQLVASSGFSTRFASEVCIPDQGLVGDWPQGNKFIFTMKARFDDEGGLIVDSGGALKNFGFGETFLIRQPANTRYMSDRRVTGDNRDKGGQVAFPDDIPLERISVYVNKVKLDPHPWKTL